MVARKASSPETSIFETHSQQESEAGVLLTEGNDISVLLEIP
jgi:hypothetical protein